MATEKDKLLETLFELKNLINNVLVIIEQKRLILENITDDLWTNKLGRNLYWQSLVT